jgi:hypothetical protein
LLSFAQPEVLQLTIPIKKVLLTIDPEKAIDPLLLDPISPLDTSWALPPKCSKAVRVFSDAILLYESQNAQGVTCTSCFPSYDQSPGIPGHSRSQHEFVQRHSIYATLFIMKYQETNRDYVVWSVSKIET